MGRFIYRVIMLLWRINPFKKFTAQTMRVLGFVNDKLYKDLKFEGWIDFTINKQKIRVYSYQSVPENEIFWKGFAKTWDKESLILWSEIAKNSKVILDIGANTGIYSLVACSANSQAKIFAFEPSKSTFLKLKRNIEENGMTIYANDVAISNQKGSFTFYDPDYKHQTNASLSRDMIKDNEVLSKSIKLKEYEVNTITCDEFLHSNQIDWPDLIKIDVEMHEPEVLEGMKETLEQGRPVILIEILTHKVSERINKLLKDKSYGYYTLNADKSPQKTDAIEPTLCFNYLLIPTEKENEIEKLWN